jgi:hypothetical protein
MVRWRRRWESKPCRFTTAPALRRRFSLIVHAFEDPYGSLEGNRLGALARLIAQNVRIYAYPMTAVDLCEWLNTASASASAWE